jgi:molecular chaperone GrpE
VRLFTTEVKTETPEVTEEGTEGATAEDAATSNKQTELEAQIAELTKTLEAAKKEHADFSKEAKNQHMRDLAEMENVRTRARIDVDNARQFGLSDFAKDIIEVADTIQLAIETTQNSTGDSKEAVDSLLEGVQMTEKILLKTFEKHSITKYDSLGEPFDPNIHDGLFQFQDPTKEPNTVGQVLKEGWMIHDRVLRVANVGTVQPPPAEDAK